MPNGSESEKWKKLSKSMLLWGCLCHTKYIQEVDCGVTSRIYHSLRVVIWSSIGIGRLRIFPIGAILHIWHRQRPLQVPSFLSNQTAGEGDSYYTVGCQAGPHDAQNSDENHERYRVNVSTVIVKPTR